MCWCLTLKSLNDKHSTKNLSFYKKKFEQQSISYFILGTDKSFPWPFIFPDLLALSLILKSTLWYFELNEPAFSYGKDLLRTKKSNNSLTIESNGKKFFFFLLHTMFDSSASGCPESLLSMVLQGLRTC